MGKFILLLTLFLTVISCTGKNESKIEVEEKLETVAGKLELLLYGCCSKDACTTCEDYNIVLEKKMEYKGEEIADLSVNWINIEEEDLYKYTDTEIKATGYINREEKTIVLEKIEGIN